MEYCISYTVIYDKFHFTSMAGTSMEARQQILSADEALERAKRTGSFAGDS